MEGCSLGPEELSTEDLEEAWSEGEYNFDGGISAPAGNNPEEEGGDGNDDDYDFMSRSWPPNGDHYGERTIDFTSQHVCSQQDHNYQKQQQQQLDDEEEEEGEDSWNPQELFNRLLLRFWPIRDEEQQQQQKEEVYKEEDFKRCLFVSETMNGEHRRECFVRILAIFLVC